MGLWDIDETDVTKQAVELKKEVLYEDLVKEYNGLWGAPLDMPGDSRAWYAR